MIFKQYYNHNQDLVDSFAQKYHISPRIMSLLVSRGLDSEIKLDEYLHPDTLLNPFDLLNMREIVERIKLAKAIGDKVLIFGDYDVDGVSATAIMIKALKKFGISADFYLPNRYIDGYGLTNAVIDKIADEYEPDLIITVDCGISCHNEVEYAKTKGIEIVVTDHHEIPDILPDTIVLNAKIKGQEFGFCELCGTGLAYEISRALIGDKASEEFLPIAAIATIADIVPLMSENRVIVRKGFELFSRYLPIGIKMLFDDVNAPIVGVSAQDISYRVSPRLNASGRMGDASDSLMLYLEQDPVKVREYILKIRKRNEKRQALCRKVINDAEKALEKQDLRKTRVICFASRAWDQGILGIACSRLVEKYHRPVFLFAYDGENLKGSGRSIDDINIHQLIVSCEDILTTYGGHTMAVGLTLERKNYEEFVNRVNSFVFEKYSDKAFIPIKYYDSEITLEEITPEFLKELKIFEPCGCGNPKPRFKITSEDAVVAPLKPGSLHAEVKLAKNFHLMFFNYKKYAPMLELSRQKSFIFEFATVGKKGTVCEFDGGKYITKDANFLTEPLQFTQLKYDTAEKGKFVFYKKDELMPLVSSLNTTTFGTAFVTFSGYDFVNFSRVYDQSNIYNVDVLTKHCVGYNSLLLSPIGTDWARNFSKIVFLSPVVTKGYLSALQKVSGAEIYIPIDRKVDRRNFLGLDLSHATFGKVYKAITNGTSSFASIFEYYHAKIEEMGIKFNTFVCAMLCFEELGLVKIFSDECFCVMAQETQKTDLKKSIIFNKLCTLKGNANGNIR